MKDLKERAIRGGLAKAVSQAATFIVRIGSLTILARLLEPRDFGLVGMVTAVTGILNLLRDFGLSTAAVQRDSVTNQEMSNLFWINISVGFCLSLLAAGIAPFLASFYHEPRLVAVGVVLAASFLINALGVQHGTLLQRHMRFVALAVIDVISLLISTALGVVVAIYGFGYWALVCVALTGPFFSSACTWMATGWIPGRPHKQHSTQSLLRFGGTVTLNGIVVYVAYNFEKVLLGRFWGADVVGIYGRAYQLSNMPTENLNMSIGGVAFSALSRLQNDPSRMRSYFLKAYSLVLALTVPITVLCALYAPDAISLLLGPKWSQAAPILRLLAPTILAFAMINPFSWVLLGTGRVNRSLQISLVIAPLVMAGYLIGLAYGPKGVALGYSIAMTLWVVPNIFWCIRGTLITALDAFRTLGRPMLSSLAAMVLPLTLQTAHLSAASPFIRLGVGGTLFLVVYAWMLLYVMGQKELYLDILKSLKRRRFVEESALADNLAT